MRNVRRRGSCVLTIVLVLTGCVGDEPADEPATDTNPTSSIDGSTAAGTGSTVATTDGPSPDPDRMFTLDACAVIGQDEPPPDLADRVPPDFADAAELLMDITGAFDTDSPIPADVVERFADQRTATDLAAFAETAERDCGPSESVDGIRFYAQISEFAAPAEQPDYCSHLTTVVSLEASDEDSLAALDAAIEVAPTEHAQALATLRGLRASDDVALPDGLDTMQTFVDAAGLGLYAEARCGVANSFATMLFVGAFLLAESDLSGQPAQGTGMAPEPADPTAATAALPAGSELTFEVIEIDLNDDGRYLVSAVIPTGWQRDDRGSGAEFEPDRGFGFFTEISLRAGCDGTCETTDWEARLTDSDGYITQWRSDQLTTERETADTPGIVMTKTGLPDRVKGAVIRWDDSTDRYLVCDFRLEQDDADYVEAFIAACEAARPGWISGT